MSKTNSKGLASLRQRVRKYNRENFESDIAAYRENPDDGESEEGGEMRNLVSNFERKFHLKEIHSE